MERGNAISGSHNTHGVWDVSALLEALRRAASHIRSNTTGKTYFPQKFVAKHSLPCCYLPAVLTPEKSIAAIHSRLMNKPLQSSWTTSPAVTERYQETVFAPRKPLLNSCTHETIRLKSAGKFLGSFLYWNLDLRWMISRYGGSVYWVSVCRFMFSMYMYTLPADSKN